MEILDAMHTIGSIYRKTDAVQTLATDHATETRGMIRLTGRPQNAIQNGLLAHATLF